MDYLFYSSVITGDAFSFIKLASLLNVLRAKADFIGSGSDGGDWGGAGYQASNSTFG
ncbi:hypothetical protein [Cellvibrio japonicus]|uniref:hypothetical protein n=1 Tax=Cellvibrio japonicus TaxID=155077 RepID=UPI001305369F|nr:hypothetical protein [Cellvibrio japonicus]